jgi:hypothetical protein
MKLFIGACVLIVASQSNAQSMTAGRADTSAESERAFQQQMKEHDAQVRRQQAAEAAAYARQKASTETPPVSKSTSVSIDIFHTHSKPSTKKPR